MKMRVFTIACSLLIALAVMIWIGSITTIGFTWVGLFFDLFFGFILFYSVKTLIDVFVLIYRIKKLHAPRLK